MSIYLKNNPAKFHFDMIWNEGALCFFEERSQQEQEQEENYTLGSEMGSVPGPEKF